MTSQRHTITGVLRKWRRKGERAVVGFVYESDIWEDGDEAALFPGDFIESVNFWLFQMGTQTYKLPKDEEIPDEPKNGTRPPFI